MENLDNGVLFIKSSKLEETDDHISRLSIRCISGGEQHYKAGSHEYRSRIASLSPHHFKRTFKKLFGHSPHDYHVKKRLEHSRHLIKAGGLNVGELCQLIGFEDPSSFIRLFRNNYGYTPGNLDSQNS